MKDIRQTFVEKLHECNQHKKRLLSAKGRLNRVMPLNVKVYNALDDTKMRGINITINNTCCQNG